MGMMTRQTPQPQAHIGEHFWIKWVLANAVGFGVAAAVSLAPVGADAWSRVAATREGVVGIVTGILSWVSAIFGAVAIGAAQWLFLRQRVRWANSWFLATSMGWLASYFVVQNLVIVLHIDSRWPRSAVIDIVPIILAALPQWLILRRHVFGACRWVVANIAGAAGGFVGYQAGVFGVFIVAFFLASFIGELWFSAILAGLIWAFMGAAMSAITGVALRQLLQRPIPETLARPASMIRAD